MTFRELGLATVPVIFGARDLLLYLSISKIQEQLSICLGRSCGILIQDLIVCLEVRKMLVGQFLTSLVTLFLSME